VRAGRHAARAPRRGRRHGHTRRLASLAGETLAAAGVAPARIDWIAADLGPGSFTGVRVGLATARALALVAGAPCSAPRRSRRSRSRAAPAVADRAARPAGRRDVYAGWYRADLHAT